MPTVRNKAGLEKVFVDNFKEVTVNTDGLEALQTTTNTKLSSIDGNITKGQDVKGVGEGLQQVLLYGRHFDGTLHPLETTTNDRLLVDVAELSNVGQLTTSSSLPAMQICGFDTGSSKFKSLNCDSDGLLKTRQINKQDIISFIPTPSWTSGAFSDIFDVRSASKIRIFGNVQTTDTLQIQYASSVDGGGVYDWIFATETVPITTIDGSICIDFVIDCPPPYIRLKNNSASNQTVSLRIVKH